MEIIKELLANSAFTALLAFIAGFFAQLLLRMQVNSHEIKKEKIKYEKQHLENLKIYAEQLISQMMKYDDLANHVSITIKNGIHNMEVLKDLSNKIKESKDSLTPKLQIHFYDLTEHQNKYALAIQNFNNTFTNGLLYGIGGQKGWNDDELNKLSIEQSEVTKAKGELIIETLKYLKDKEEKLFQYPRFFHLLKSISMRHLKKLYKFVIDSIASSSDNSSPKSFK